MKNTKPFDTFTPFAQPIVIPYAERAQKWPTGPIKNTHPTRTELESEGYTFVERFSKSDG